MKKNNVGLVELSASVLNQISGGGNDKPKPEPKPEPKPKEPPPPEPKHSDAIKPYLWIWD